jgi:hypothetical protein
VLLPRSIVVLVLCAVLALGAAYYLMRHSLIDDRLLAVAGLLEVGLLVQLVVGLAHAGDIGGADGATFVAYLFTVVIVPPFVVFLAIKEKTGWAMGVILVGAFVCAVLIGRLEQVWGMAHA